MQGLVVQKEKLNFVLFREITKANDKTEQPSAKKKKADEDTIQYEEKILTGIKNYDASMKCRFYVLVWNVQFCIWKLSYILEMWSVVLDSPAVKELWQGVEN